ncbi:hypothetical protein AWN68_02680 [Roseivirga echinicomitans]|uniref:Uncharacterized protein n=1 Tax=Roseivirga echinicomitans TaxID=296218 RepID=A0A150XY77_9BACT|nr:hypothetical protein AWN68_02680 [Roseivirga echinicomitans]
MKVEGMFFYNKERHLEEYLQVVSRISDSCMPWEQKGEALSMLLRRNYILNSFALVMQIVRKSSLSNAERYSGKQKRILESHSTLD